MELYILIIMKLLWSEKYRPVKLEDIKSQNETITVIKNLIDNGNLPHLIFYGPPGTGKTSTILSICNEIFPDDIKYNRYFEFNASDDRGIKFIRDKIKKISNLKIIDRDGIPHIKIIILDEVDTLTSDSQYALRRIMENSASYTRFCLICNYPNKLIEPIISRCAQFRFKPIPDKVMEQTLKSILNKENIKNSSKGTKLIIKNSYGDLRLATSYLQRYYKEKQTPQSIFGIIDHKDLLKMIKTVSDHDKFWINIKKFIDSNIHLTFQISPLLDLITNIDTIPDNIKVLLVDDITLIDHYIVKGINNELLWNYLALSFINHLDGIENI